jgi:uncharacterized repeat protein (TIGR01451 family)
MMGRVSLLKFAGYGLLAVLFVSGCSSNKPTNKTTTTPVLGVASTHSGSFTQGQQGATYTVTVSNSGTGATSAAVTLTDTVPSGMTLVSMAGTGWTCSSNSCTRSDALATSSSYPAVTVTVNISASATSPLVNQVSVSGGGSVAATANDSTTINPSNQPVLTITKTHQGNFALSQQNATYTVMVSDAANAPSTAGTVTVTDTIPSGLTLVSMAGTGWTCVTNTCTRVDALAGGASYPAITVTVNVAANASTPQVNQVTVSGGGAASASAQDSTTITGGATAGCGGAPGGSEILVSGKYAFFLQGFQGSNAGTPIASAGSFSADGAGNITGGEVDFNGASGASHLAVTSSGSLYKVALDPTGAGYMGCLTLSTSASSATFHFSLGGKNGSNIFTKGRIIRFDDTTGTGTRGSGVLRLQDATAFSTGDTSQLKSNYAFGLDGVDFAGGHFAIAGSFALNPPNGAVSNLAFDADDAGSLLSNVTGGTGTFTTDSSTPTTGYFLFTLSAGGNTNHEAVYVVNANEFFVLQTDAFGSGNSIISGRGVVTASSFTQSSLSGQYIIHLTGIDTSCTVNSTPAQCADVNLGLLDLTSGTLSGTLYEYEIGNVTPAQTISGGTYTVASSSGRVTLTGAGNHPPVAYLAVPATDGISVFFVGTDNSSAFGIAESSSGSFTTAGLAGNYFFSTEDPGDNTVASEVGVASVTSGGVVIGTGDQSGSNGLGSQAISATVSITNSNGIGTVTSGSDPAVPAITNGTKLFFIDEGGTGGTDPATIVVVEQQ